jgi:hypothetical protein
MKKILFSLVLLVFTLNSCTLEKRYHNSGYNIDWNFSSSKNEPISNKKPSKLSKNQSNESQINKISSESFGISKASETPTPSQTFSLQNSESFESINQPTSQNIESNTSTMGIAGNSNTVLAESNNPKLNLKTGMFSPSRNLKYLTFNNFQKNDKKSLKNDNRLQSAAKNQSIQKSENSSNSGSGTRVFGTLLIIIGVILIIFVSIIFGFILMALGLLLRAVAGPKNQPTPPPVVESKPQTDDKKVEYVDVVYLKNGSVIRGLIMEQIPNETLKIQTADGSLFVYKMEEVVKITKEEKK